MNTIRVSGKWRSLIALLALLAGTIASTVPAATPVRAATSADPSQEIVYIDPDGVIRVLDTAGSELVTWHSPTGNWKDADLGDVNADGDLEIVAIGSDSDGTVKVAIFDPVIATGIVDPNKTFPPPPEDGIPWDTLWETALTGWPDIVLSANFDNGIEGDELLYAYRDHASVSQVVVMNADGLDPVRGKPDGRHWKEHVQFTDPTPGRTWRYGRAGDVNDKDSDEAVLVDSKSDPTLFDVISFSGGGGRLDGKHSESDDIRKVAVGQIIASGGDEIAEIRSTKPGSDALKVYEWDPVDADLTTDESWAFSPQPEAVFLADLDGDTSKEVLFLRNNSSEDGSRLIMVDEWGDDQDNQLDIELSLSDIPGGADDEFKLGAGGDVDGDARDEIIIASGSRIVIFRDPHPGGSVGAGSRTEILRDTNNDTLLVGDLDSQGYIQGPVFGADKTRIESALPMGTSATAGTVRIQNVGSGGNVPFSVVTPLPAWVRVSPMTGVTPSTLTVTFDATTIPVGVRTATMQITSSAAVVNKPFPIDLQMTVEAPALSLNPVVASAIYFPCTPPITETMQLVVDVGGTAGLTFEAVVIGVPELEAEVSGFDPRIISGGQIDETGTVILYDGAGGETRFPRTARQDAVVASFDWPNYVDWINQATSLTNTVPASVTLGFDPAVEGADFATEHAVMVFVADTRAGSPPDNVEILPVKMMCAQDRVMAPTLAR